MNKNIKLFSIILISLVVFISAMLAIKNYPFSGLFKIEMALGENTPLISNLGPEVRVKDEVGYQRVLETPVYFNVRTMPWYNRAEIYVTYKADGVKLNGVGGQTAPGFNYHVNEPISTRLLEEDWYKAIFEFDLKNVYELDNFRRFVVATSNEQDDNPGELRVKEIKVILFK